jgi:hypothetical protein
MVLLRNVAFVITRYSALIVHKTSTLGKMLMTKAKTLRMNTSELFQAWRLADQEARTAERVMLDDAMRSVEGLCPFPSSTRREQSTSLRAGASELLLVAMATMDARH